MKPHIALGLIAAVGLSGCSHLLSQKVAKLVPSQQDTAKGETVTIPAQLRTLTIKPAAASFLSCAEPSPDVAMSDSLRLITALSADRTAGAKSADGASADSTKKSSISNDLATTTTALALDGRTQTVLLAREFLFRTCEAAANGWLSPADVKEAHLGTLSQITAMTKADDKKAETTGALIAASAGVTLDVKVLAAAGEAARASTRATCAAQFETCLTKAGTDDKAKTACRTQLDLCLK